MYNMDISIGSYKCRLEIVLIIVFLLIVLFGHTLCACSTGGLLEGLDNMDKKDDKIGEIMVKNKAYEKLKDEDFAQRNKIRTMMCLSFIKDGKCAYGKGCIFAHSKEELRKSICLFGKYCVNKKCNFDFIKILLLI